MHTFVNQKVGAVTTNSSNSFIRSHEPTDQQEHFQRPSLFSTAGKQDGPEDRKPSLDGPPHSGFDFGKISILSPQQARLQPKLKINTPGDKYEREADRVAEQVMRMPEPQVQHMPQWTPPTQPNPFAIQRKCDACAKDEEEKTLQAKSAGNTGGVVPPAIAQQIQSSRGNGQMMDMGTRSFMEARFGADFGGVRIHDDNNAALFNQRLQARAFTLGRDVYFNQGQYSPGDAYVREGEALKDKLMRMEMPEVQAKSVAVSSVQRKCSPCAEEEKELQRKENNEVNVKTNNPLESYVSGLHNSGQPLSKEARSFFEPRFGYDFSKVRIHTDHAAAASATSINAQAYTSGNNIVFNGGKYSMQTNEGKRLLGHELTHIIQQEGGINSKPSFNRSDKNIQRKGFESTIEICHRVLRTRTFNILKGGVRVALQIQTPDKEIIDCNDHDFHLTLTRIVDWGFDTEVATCKVSTGKSSVVQIGAVPTGDYYFTIWRSFDHPYCCVIGDIQVYDETISKGDSTCEKLKQLSTMDIVHGALDIAGFIPVLGAVPDGINAIIYVAEGDWANAGISAVAMIPAFGDGVKATTMAGKAALKITEKKALQLGEEGIAKVLKEAKTAHTAEEATKVVSKGGKEVEKEAGKAISVAEKKADKALIAGTKEHKTARWNEYKERGGKWNYERWSKQYEVNLKNPVKGNDAADAYRKQIGWGKREVTVDVGNGEVRRLDIADVADKRGIEVKSGKYFSKTTEIMHEIERDARLVKDGWEITWKIDGKASKPLLDELKKRGIKVIQ